MHAGECSEDHCGDPRTVHDRGVDGDAGHDSLLKFCTWKWAMLKATLEQLRWKCTRLSTCATEQHQHRYQRVSKLQVWCLGVRAAV